LLSVLPLIIVLRANASHRIQDDIARHLGLSAQGTRVVDGLFKVSPSSFNLAVLIGQSSTGVPLSVPFGGGEEVGPTALGAPGTYVPGVRD
jgi:hypothetical protein